MTLQNLFEKLNEYWATKGCALLQPYDIEVGAGTMHPATTLKVLGPDSWNVAYVQPSRRPTDGRYTRNPMRSQRYYQYQVVLKPSPADVVDLYLGSLEALGLDLKQNDVRLVEDDWESPSVGASGIGWEVWLDGTEITQFTFFQQMGGIECEVDCAEITYGAERLCLALNKGYSFWEDLMWNEYLSYKDVNWQLEMQHNVYNFEVASTEMLFKLFDAYEEETKRILNTPIYWDHQLQILTTSSFASKNEEHLAKEKGPLALVYPAFEMALKCSHLFNIIDARGAIGSSERGVYINRIRASVRSCCLKYMEQFRPKVKDKHFP